MPDELKLSSPIVYPEFEWFVIHAGTETGPFTTAQLLEAIDAGNIADDDLIKSKGGLWSKACDGCFGHQMRSLESRKRPFDKIRYMLRRMIYPPIIFGMFIGILFVGGFEQIQKARFHQGPGFVWYEDDKQGVTEEAYKRHYYTMGAMLVGIGVLFWYIAAKYTARK